MPKVTQKISEDIQSSLRSSKKQKTAIFTAIVSKYSDWREFLVKRLTGARTLPINFYAKLWSTIRSQFRPGMKLEVVDKMRICQVLL